MINMSFLPKQEAVDHFQWIKECRFTEIEPEIVLSRVLTGEYISMKGEIDGEIVGIAILRAQGTTLFVVGCWCKNNLSRFMDSFIDLVKGSGFEKIRAYSDADPKAYEKLTNMKKIYSVFEREI